MSMKFMRCNHCGNIVAMVKESGVPVVCCGDNMTELIPNTTDGASERHVPVCEINGTIVHVKVGDIAHPMDDDHYIQWIAIQTSSGNQRKCLKPNDTPEACFALCEGDEVIAIYEYCNLHGLWVANCKQCQD